MENIANIHIINIKYQYDVIKYTDKKVLKVSFQRFKKNLFSKLFFSFPTAYQIELLTI